MSSTYKTLITTASKYVDTDTVVGVVGRQLRPGMTPDAFSRDDLKSIMIRVTTALKLYVPDVSKRAEMIAAIQQLA